MKRSELEHRTKAFAIRIIRLVGALPRGRVGDVLGRQILKSGTSIGANYCESAHASSRAHFISTMEISQRETHETLYWIELIKAAELVKPERLDELTHECREILAIITASIVTAKKKTESKKL